MKTNKKAKNISPSASKRATVRVRELREARGMSATQLAIESGVGLGEISLIERGAIGLGDKRAVRIADALAVEVRELFES